MAYLQGFQGLTSARLPNAALTDTTAPTFAGITGTTPNTDGSVSAAWSLASDSTPPIEYNIYVALGVVTAAALFTSTNLVTISPAGTTSKRIFTLADQTTYLVNGQQYTMGVRARDAVGNIDSNLVISTPTAIASGNLPAVFQSLASAIAATEVLLAADHVNFQADHADFQNDHSDFQSDHANFVADDALFDADHVNFQTDHTNFQTDHTNFQADHTNFIADHTNFLADHASFLADHANFVQDNADFVTNLATFVTHLNTFSSYLTTLGADITQINAIIAQMESVLSSISIGGGVGLTARVDLETVLNVELIESV